jgi:pyruvate/2-oxoglutarate dehydrogenase complex dihydrolipoamide dehydrogenase (E3) component
MTLKIGVIGGGWYGCHISASLLSLGFDVKLFEVGGRLLDKASANNQFRLHQGFHYARHYRTRQQSRYGFSKVHRKISYLK